MGCCVGDVVVSERGGGRRKEDGGGGRRKEDGGGGRRKAEERGGAAKNTRAPQIRDYNPSSNGNLFTPPSCYLHGPLF